MTKTVAGLFRTFDDAQTAINALLAAGFDHQRIDLVANNDGDRFAAGSGHLNTNGRSGTAVVEATLVGAGEGAVIGGLTGLAFGLVTLLVPGVGPVLAMGALATALAGAEIGALGGSLIAALTDLGLTKPEADRYMAGIRDGGALVMVRTSNREDTRKAADILDRFDPLDISWGSWMSFGSGTLHDPIAQACFGGSDPDLYAEEDSLTEIAPEASGIREYAARL